MASRAFQRSATVLAVACMATATLASTIDPVAVAKPGTVHRIVGGKPVPSRCATESTIGQATITAEGFVESCPGACKRSETVVALVMQGWGGGGGGGGSDDDFGGGDWGANCPGAWETEFPCMDNQQCIPLAQDCDGTKHCNDGSDEIGCSRRKLQQSGHRHLLEADEIPWQCLEDEAMKEQRVSMARADASTYSQYCGGEHMALVAGDKSMFVVTAAHCVWETINMKAGSWEKIPGNFVVLGERDLKQDEGGEEIIEMDEVFVHAQYDHDLVKYDIAVIKLKSAPTKNRANSVENIADAPNAKTLAMVTGWGLLEAGGVEAPSILNYVQVPIRTDAECSASYPDGGYNSAVEVCAGLSGGGKDSCQGDSGGPLYYQAPAADGQSCVNYYIGTVSWGQGCAEAGYFGVYTRASTFKDWIKNLMVQNSPPASPTNAPVAPTGAPTAGTPAPTGAPTDAPAPTDPPVVPTAAPTDAPTDSPTSAPTDSPTDAPTSAPTETVTPAPTRAPPAPTAPIVCPETPAPTDSGDACPDGQELDCDGKCFDTALAGENNGVCDDPASMGCMLQDDTVFAVDMIVQCTMDFMGCMAGDQFGLFDENGDPVEFYDSDTGEYQQIDVDTALQLTEEWCQTDFNYCSEAAESLATGAHELPDTDDDDSDYLFGVRPKASAVKGTPGYPDYVHIVVGGGTPSTSMRAVDHQAAWDTDSYNTNWPNLYCAAFNYDAEDCQVLGCDWMYQCGDTDNPGVYDCDWDQCLMVDDVAEQLVDGVCAPNLNCARFAFDGEACLDPAITAVPELMSSIRSVTPAAFRGYQRPPTNAAPTDSPATSSPTAAPEAPTAAAPSPTAAPASEAPAGDSGVAPGCSLPLLAFFSAMVIALHVFA